MIGIVTILLMFSAALAAQVVPASTWPPPLHNLGNSCYLNSILQVFAHLPPLTIDGQKHELFDNVLTKVQQEGFLFDNALEKVLLHARNQETRIDINPAGTWKDQIDIIRQTIFPDNAEGQKDAHEALIGIGQNLKSPTMKEEWKRYFTYKSKYHRSHTISTGETCYHPSQEEPQSDLKVPIPQKNDQQNAAIDLQTTINHLFTEPSHLSGDNQIRCEKNNNQSFQGTEFLIITHYPPCFIVHLKRFIGNRDGSTQKITTPVTVQENIIIKKFNYALHAIICHSGDLEGGHYWAYVKKDNHWYKCDDEKILPINFNNFATSSDHYIFFFVYQDPISDSPSLSARSCTNNFLNFIENKSSSDKKSALDYAQEKNYTPIVEQLHKAVE